MGSNYSSTNWRAVWAREELVVAEDGITIQVIHAGKRGHYASRNCRTECLINLAEAGYRANSTTSLIVLKAECCDEGH